MSIEQALAVLENCPDFRVLRRVPEKMLPAKANEAETGLMLIVDTETTGMNKATDRVIELGMLLVRFHIKDGVALELVELYSALEDPGMPLSATVKTVTGLSDTDLVGKKIEDSVVERLTRGVDWVIAHHAAFDRPFLERRWPVFKQANFACSVQEIDWLAAGYASAKLELLVHAAGYFYGSHRALNDCWALLLLLQQRVATSTVLAQLINQAQQPSFLLNIQVRYDDKDLLKALGGFYWQEAKGEHYPAKSWMRSCKSRKELNQLLESLYKEVFRRCSFQCLIGQLDARQRYSTSSVPLQPYRYPC